MAVRGWVYIISNRAMPKLVKVGFSERDPVARAAELGAGTEVPFRYELVFDVLVYSPYEVEQDAHNRLSSLRAGKEWFECDWESAVAAVKTSAKARSIILAEKEYESLIHFRSEQARIAEQLREKDRQERQRIEQEIRAKHARDVGEKALSEQSGIKRPTQRIQHTRIAICPKCHSNVKTSGKPPPYFCIGCGNKFSVGL